MAVCPVCGCKTDEIDFVECRLGSSDVRLCSFCNRQLMGFGEGKAVSEGHGRWLSSVIAKDVPGREQWVLDELLRLRESAPTLEEQGSVAAVRNVTGGVSVAFGNNSEAELLERIETLERQLRSLKRSILIKSILEVCIPVILGIILLLIFLSSDLFDSLSGLYNFFV